MRKILFLTHPHITTSTHRYRTARDANRTNKSLQEIIYFNRRYYNINTAGIINKCDLDERREVNSFVTSKAASYGG